MTGYPVLTSTFSRLVLDLEANDMSPYDILQLIAHEGEERQHGQLPSCPSPEAALDYSFFFSVPCLVSFLLFSFTFFKHPIFNVS